MEDKTPYYATVAYDSIHAPELKKLCKKLQITQKEFIPLAVEYFLHGQLDPRDSLEEVKNDFRTVVKDRKSTRLNSSHVRISYAVFCLNKKLLSSADHRRSEERTCQLPRRRGLVCCLRLVHTN